MAKCPKCGKIWHCSGEGAEMSFEKDESKHCSLCRCEGCRIEKGIDNKSMESIQMAFLQQEKERIHEKVSESDLIKELIK